MKKTTIWIGVMLLLGLMLGCQGTQATTTAPPVTTVDTANIIDISSANDLAAIEMNRSYRLVADLDLTGVEWIPLGNGSQPYLGIFDGNGHTIRNLTITDDHDGFIGLFGWAQGIIKDLTIADFSIDVDSASMILAGGLAGRIQGNVENVIVSGDIVIESDGSNVYAGLLAGQSDAIVTATMAAADFEANRIHDAQADGTLTINAQNIAYAGGLIGKIYNSIVYNTQIDAALDISSAGSYRSYAGGLVGHHYGGLLVGFEEYVTSIELPLSDNFICAEITLQSTGSQGIAGGFAGYSQNGIYQDNIVDASVLLKGKTLYGGLFVGEAFQGNFKRNLGVGSLAAESETDQSVTITALYGFQNGETVWTDNFYLLETSLPIASDFTGGELATTPEITDAAWYPIWMDGNDDFWDFNDIALHFGE